MEANNNFPVIPCGNDQGQYRSIVHLVSQGIRTENFEQVLYLCKDIIPENGPATKSFLGLIQFFEYNKKLSCKDASLLVEILYRINRIDLMKKIIPSTKPKHEFESHFLASGHSHFTPFRILMFELYEDLSQLDFDCLKFQCSDHMKRRALDEATDVFSLLRKLEEFGVVDAQDFRQLIELLGCIGNPTPFTKFQRLQQGDLTIVLPERFQKREIHHGTVPFNMDNPIQWKEYNTPTKPDFNNFENFVPQSVKLGNSNAQSLFYNKATGTQSYQPQANKSKIFMSGPDEVDSQKAVQYYRLPGHETSQRSMETQSFQNPGNYYDQGEVNVRNNKVYQEHSVGIKGQFYPYQQQTSNNISQSYSFPDSNYQNQRNYNHLQGGGDFEAQPGRNLQVTSHMSWNASYPPVQKHTQYVDVLSETSTHRIAQEHSENPLNSEMRELNINQEAKVQQSSHVTNAIQNTQTEIHKYKMSSKPVGICLLINNENFKSNFNKEDYEQKKQANISSKIKLDVPKSLDDRPGSSIDANAIEDLFKSFSFDVRRYDDVKCHDMQKHIQNISELSHTDYDCFVFVILSHGKKNTVYSIDGYSVKISDIQRKFSPDECPTLLNKPKLIFIQACAGNDDMPGFGQQPTDDQVVEDIHTDGDCTPKYADFLLAHSTVPGFVSYRSISKGSWFISALVNNLKKHYKHDDLLSIIVKTNDEVSRKEFVQIPMPIVTLRRKIYFTMLPEYEKKMLEQEENLNEPCSSVQETVSPSP